MLKHAQLTESRITKTIARIRDLLYTPTLPLQVAAHHISGEPIPAEEALQREYGPFEVGQRWGSMWGTTWFRFTGEIPADWKGREVVALVQLGAMGGEGFTNEGLVWQDGVPTRAINVHRADVPLASKAMGGEAVHFHVEAAANPNAQQHAYDLAKVDADGQSFVLRQADLACFNREAYDFLNDFRLASEAMGALPEDSLRRGQLRYALNAATNLFDPEDPSTIPLARKALKAVLGKRNGDTVHRLSAIGHAHIDTAWLWPLRETIRKCARTFSTALAYMEEYPDYVFGCSQPQQYAWMKHYYPTIFEGIKAAVKRGQWDAMGSMWIEADCNLSSGESLIRQILHGKNFFLNEFGVESTDVWIPDVFGYSASMPQIMQKSGVTEFLTQKISWNQFNKFPHHTFLWEGLDGTQIFTHFPPADTYNADFSAQQLVFNATNFRENDRATRSLYVYGFGDGGGGPTKQMLEAASRLKDFEGLPRVELEKVSTFFAKAKADAIDLPVWVGELYLELHRGTYTTQARNKRGNRKCELLLRDSEFFSSIAPLQSGGTTRENSREIPEHAVYDVSARNGETSDAAWLDRAWKLLLLNQFHDIIPGSSINWVYRDSDRDYETIRTLATVVRDDARDQLATGIDTSAFAKPVIVFNTLSDARREVISLPDGTPMMVEVPSCGYAVIDGSKPTPAHENPVSVEAVKGQIVLDNGIIRLEIDGDGLLARVFDYRASREVLASGTKGNLFQLHRDLPNAWDAWDVDIFYKETHQDLTAAESVKVLENTALRAKVRVVRKFGKSRTQQDIILCANSPRIDFETQVDWQEDHKLLKVAFPVNVRSPRATYEIQYGHTERPTHYNTSWDLARFEVCAQKWADLSEADYGVALLNDCKYGHDIFGNVMRISLLRSSTAPDFNADRGKQEFTYSLLPHSEGFRKGNVIEQGYALNVPLLVHAAESSAGSLPSTASYFSVDRTGVIIESIKKAENEDAIIVRLYEAHGTRGRVTLTTTLPLTKAFTADMLERTIGSVKIADGAIKLNVTPFEIITLKLQA